MYVRSKNAALTGAKATASRGDSASAKYIPTLTPRYGTTEVTRSPTLRSRRGLAYADNDSRQNPGSRRTSPAAVDPDRAGRITA
jgi:hypothetical protein